MELITIILSGLLAVFSSGGWVVNAIAHKQLNSYIDSAEELAIRIDNTPNYQIARGNLERLRIAGRGVYLEPNLRIDSVELETDPIALDLGELSTESIDELRNSLEKPLQGAFSIVITKQDLKNALQSEDLRAKLQSALNRLIASRAGSTSITYEIMALDLDLAPNNLLIEVILDREREIENRSAELAIALSIGLELIQGKKIKVSKLEGTVNNRPISNRLLNGFAQGISDRLDLTTIEQQGIFARLLQLEITDDKIATVGFVRMETKSVSNSSMIDEVNASSALYGRSTVHKRPGAIEDGDMGRKSQRRRNTFDESSNTLQPSGNHRRTTYARSQTK